MFRKLEKIGPPPHDALGLCTQRDCLSRLDGDVSFCNMCRMLRMYTSVPEASLADLFRFWKILEDNFENLYSECTTINLLERVPRLDIPTFFLMGRNDHCVFESISTDFIDHLQAPSKQVVWFEESGHVPFLDEPDKFNDAMIQIVHGLK